MKILIIAVVLVASVAIIASISLVAIPNTQVHTCTLCPNIPSSGQPLEITNISIEPPTVTLGTSFLIYADVFNPNPYSIYVNNGCISSVSATFDKNVEIQKGISCFSMSKQEIPSLQKTRIHGPSIGTIYNATSAGNTNATIMISYVAAGSVGTITTSKFFTIDTPSNTPRGLTLEEQLCLANSCIGPNDACRNSHGAKNNNPFEIVGLMYYYGSGPCGVGVCPLNTFNLKMNSNHTAYLLGYNICDGNSCIVRNDLSILLPLNVIGTPDYKFIALPENPQWKYDDVFHIQVEVSSISDNKTAIWTDLGNSTIIH
ncbi:MAG: hypothetical protein ACYDAJ_02225 [Nitrosotalea sp.]